MVGPWTDTSCRGWPRAASTPARSSWTGSPTPDGSGILFAALNGINATAAQPDEDEKWFWLVQPTGKRSEFPEVFDCGTEDSPEAAKSKATAALIEADCLYQTAGPEGW